MSNRSIKIDSFVNLIRKECEEVDPSSIDVKVYFRNRVLYICKASDFSRESKPNIISTMKSFYIKNIIRLGQTKLTLELERYPGNGLNY